MNKLTVIFLLLLGVATFASGQVWTQAETFANGQGDFLGAVLGILSAIVLASTLLALGRIVYRTTPRQQEDNHA